MLAQAYDLSDEEFFLFQELIYAETGISLSDKKKRLVVARLSKRLRALNLNNFTEYYAYLKDNPERELELGNLINRITTNKTDFFRERHHFDFLRQEILPQIIKAGTSSGARRLRIWSAGCSSGEEPYSIAMTVDDAFQGQRGWDIKILATDLDTDILKKAAAGCYPTQTIAPIPKEYLLRFFVRNGSEYELVPRIKSMVVFRRLNLMSPLFPMKKPFDVIFCRNVIIYFDAPTKLTLMNKFAHHLSQGGYMFIGHSESLMNMKDTYRYLKNTIYQKV